MICISISVCLISCAVFIISRLSNTPENTPSNIISDIVNKEDTSEKNFDNIIKEYYQKVKKRQFWGINVYTVNQNVEATYISSTLYNVENKGDTDVSYELDVVVDVSNKTTWSVSGNLSGNAKGSIKSFKTDLAAKAGIDYSNTKTESRKETQKLKVKRISP